METIVSIIISTVIISFVIITVYGENKKAYDKAWRGGWRARSEYEWERYNGKEPNRGELKYDV